MDICKPDQMQSCIRVTKIIPITHWDQPPGEFKVSVPGVRPAGSQMWMVSPGQQPSRGDRPLLFHRSQQPSHSRCLWVFCYPRGPQSAI